MRLRDVTLIFLVISVEIVRARKRHIIIISQYTNVERNAMYVYRSIIYSE